MIRWKQRYDNFSKALSYFQATVSEFPQLSKLEKEGLIHRFEYTFELAWKTLKDFLDSQGIAAAYPREVIKQAFHYGLIQDGEIWMDMLEARNQMSHVYNEDRFNEIVAKIVNQYSTSITLAHSHLGEQL